MVEGYGKAILRLLKAHGCTYVRPGKGDHEIWFSPITQNKVTVDRNCPSRFTANAILKQAGIKERL
jgi:predicted RNA binding protein YcfA (HicA-like mRNA interferase family)